MSIYSIYALIFKLWRAKRFRLFLDTIKPTRVMRLLDVGGYPWGWLNFPPCVRSITCLNIHTIDWDTSRSPQHNITVAVGDARNMEHIGDKKYDVVFSNSVSEHVGSWSDQEDFAREVRRVGKKLWVQTPARECPFEPHYLAPFMHWLPKHMQKRLIRWCSVYGLVQQPSPAEIGDMVESIRLLTKKEMETLFPDCKILVEKIFVLLPKSYIAFRNE
jgi:hypothetical protein